MAIVVKCLPGRFIVVKCNECEAPIALAGLPVFRQSHSVDGAAVSKQLPEVLLSAAKWEVAHVNSVLLDQSEGVSYRFYVEVGPVKLFKETHLSF